MKELKKKTNLVRSMHNQRLAQNNRVNRVNRQIVSQVCAQLKSKRHHSLEQKKIQLEKKNEVVL